MNASILLLCTHEQSCVRDVSTCICTLIHVEVVHVQAKQEAGGGDNDAVTVKRT